MAPSVAPATDNVGADFKVAHRRVNLDGQVSAFSPVLDTNLPADITPQGYAQTTEYLADQILVSNDGGTTWKLSPTQAKGVQTVAVWDANWQTVVDQDTQNSVLSSVQLGTFSSLSNPSRTLFVFNTGVGVQSFTYSFIDSLTNQVANQYSGLIQIDLEGVYAVAGSSPSSTHNSSLIWQSGQALNTQRLVLGGGQFAKITVRLINFPSGGFGSQELSLSLQIVANQTTFQLPFSERWPNRTFLVDGNNFKYQLFEGVNGFLVNVRPFMVNLNGRLIVNYFNRQVNLGQAGSTRWIAVLDNGDIRAYPEENDVPANGVLIGVLTATFSSPWLTGVSYKHTPRPDSWGFGGGALDEGRFCNLDSTDGMETVSSADDAIGVSFGSGFYATSGMVRIQADVTLERGDVIQPTSDGKATTGGSSGVVIEGAAAEEFALVQLKL